MFQGYRSLVDMVRAKMVSVAREQSKELIQSRVCGDFGSRMQIPDFLRNAINQYVEPSVRRAAYLTEGFRGRLRADRLITTYMGLLTDGTMLFAYDPRNKEPITRSRLEVFKRIYESRYELQDYRSTIDGDGKLCVPPAAEALDRLATDVFRQAPSIASELSVPLHLIERQMSRTIEYHNTGDTSDLYRI